MHELSLSSAIVETVLAHAGERRVTRVNMTIGALRQVVAESLEFWFEIVSRGTACEGARLEQVYVPARVRCPSCGSQRTLDEPLFRCPDCESPCEVTAGEEFMVESIEVEEVACTAPR